VIRTRPVRRASPPGGPCQWPEVQDRAGRAVVTAPAQAGLLTVTQGLAARAAPSRLALWSGRGTRSGGHYEPTADL